MITLFTRKSVAGAIMRLVGIVSVPLWIPLWALGLLPYIYVYNKYLMRPFISGSGRQVFKDSPWINYPAIIRVVVCSGFWLLAPLYMGYLPWCGLRWIITAKWTCKTPLFLVESIL